MKGSSAMDGGVRVEVRFSAPTPADGNPVELAVEAETAWSDESDLEGAFSRLSERTTDMPLGVGWKGAYEFTFTAWSQVAKFWRAIRAAFPSNRVSILIRHLDTEIRVEADNTSSEELVKLLRGGISGFNALGDPNRK